MGLRASTDESLRRSIFVQRVTVDLQTPVDAETPLAISNDMAFIHKVTVIYAPEGASLHFGGCSGARWANPVATGKLFTDLNTPGSGLACSYASQLPGELILEIQGW